ncbi:MAG: ArsR family transcriptional regulator [Candidatus Woesearchaeota archaeon]
MFRKIKLCNFQIEEELDLNAKLAVFTSSLGMYSVRDKDKSMYRIFLELFKSSLFDEGLKSSDLAKKTGRSRGTIVFHLNKMLDSGLIIQKDNKYYLREKNLNQLVDTLKKDIDRYLEDLKTLGKDIDVQMENMKETNKKDDIQKKN